MKMEVYDYEDFLKHEKDVTHLHLSKHEAYYDTTKFKKLKGLTFLSLRKEPVPDWVADLSELEFLELGYFQFTELPDSFSSLKKLKSLKIRSYELETFPLALLKMEQLEELDLSYCSIKSLPASICLPALRKINFEGNTFDNKVALDFLLQLDALEEYVLPSTMSLQYSFGKANPDVYYFDKFFAVLCKNRRTLIDKDAMSILGLRALCFMFKQDKEALAKIPMPDIYLLLNAGSAKYREMALDYLKETIDMKGISLRDKRVSIIGKLKVKKAEIPDWIAETGAILEAKFNTQQDFVIIGEQPGKELQAVLKSGVNILLERNIWDIKDSAYLMEEQGTVQKNLKELIQNHDPENLEIAFQLMDQGGMPREVVEEMIALMLFHTDVKIRKRSKVLFDRFLDFALPDNTKKLLEIQAYRIKDDKKITEYLRNLVKDTDLDLETIAYTVYRASSKEQAQGLCLTLPKTSELVINDYIDTNGILVLEPHTRLDLGLFLEKFPATIEKVIPVIKLLKFDAAKIKDEEEYKRLKGLKGLEINNGHSRSLPKHLFYNTDLEELKLSAYGITKIDKSIGDLQKLSDLSIYLPKVNTLPKEFGHLTKLKTLTFMWGKRELPLEILNFNKLTNLYIGYELDSFQKAFEALASFPDLKRVYIKASKNCPVEDQNRIKQLEQFLSNKTKK